MAGPEPRPTLTGTGLSIMYPELTKEVQVNAELPQVIAANTLLAAAPRKVRASKDQVRRLKNIGSIPEEGPSFEGRRSETRKSLVACFMIALTLATVATSQTRRWDYRYRAWGGQNFARVPLVGPGGDIYVAGTVEDSNMVGTTNFEMTVARITTSGALVWMTKYDDPQHLSDQAVSMAIGADGNVYAGGHVKQGIGSNGDFAVLSLTPDGDQRWIYTQPGRNGTGDEASAVVCGPDSNIYAAGTIGGSGDDFVVLSLSANEEMRWTYTYDDSTHGDDHARCMTRGPGGNLYAAGHAYDDAMGADQLVVVCLTPDGNPLWVYRYANGFSIALRIICGADSNLYVAGACTDTGHDFLVLSLTPQGVERWTYRYNGTANSDDYAYGLIWGSDGNLYALGGGFAGSPAVGQTSIISLTPSGTERWKRFYGPSMAWHGEFGLEHLHPIAQGTDGNIYAISQVADSNYWGHGRVMSLTTDGNPRWTYEYNGSGTSHYYQGAVPNGVLWGPDSELYVAGMCWDRDTAQRFELFSLDPTIGIAEQPPARTIRHCAARISRSMLDYDLNLPAPGPVALALVATQGREVASWRVQAGAGSTHHQQNLSNLSAGIYFLTVRIPGASRPESAKLVLVR